MSNDSLVDRLPPHVSFCDTVANPLPPKVSRTIWIAHNISLEYDPIEILINKLKSMKEI